MRTGQIPSMFSSALRRSAFNSLSQIKGGELLRRRRYTPDHAVIVIRDEDHTVWRFDNVDRAPQYIASHFKEPGKEWFFGDLTFPPMERNHLITNLLRSVPATMLGNECGITEFRHLGMTKEQDRKWCHMSG